MWLAPWRLLAHRAAHFAHTVGNRTDEADAGTAAEHRRAANALASHVGMATGLADRKAGDEQPRTFVQATLDRLLQAEVGAGRVAHGREAAHQHVAHDLAALRTDQRRRLLRQADQVVRCGNDVDVGVDQPRQHGAAVGIDDLRVVDLQRPLRKRRDAVAFDDQRAGACTRHRAVEHRALTMAWRSGVTAVARLQAPKLRFAGTGQRHAAADADAATRPIGIVTPRPIDEQPVTAASSIKARVACFHAAPSDRLHDAGLRRRQSLRSRATSAAAGTTALTAAMPCPQPQMSFQAWPCCHRRRRSPFCWGRFRAACRGPAPRCGCWPSGSCRARP